MKAAKIIVSVALLAISSNAFGALYKVINNGTQAVTVMLHIVTHNNIFGSSDTLKADKLQPGSYKFLNAGGGRHASTIYLFPAAVKNPKRLKLGALNNNSDRVDFNERLEPSGDYTFLLRSDPDPKNPNNVVWTISYRKGT
jgi:hypothetical protein